MKYYTIHQKRNNIFVCVCKTSSYSDFLIKLFKIFNKISSTTASNSFFEKAYHKKSYLTCFAVKCHQYRGTKEMISKMYMLIEYINKHLDLNDYYSFDYSKLRNYEQDLNDLDLAIVEENDYCEKFEEELLNCYNEKEKIYKFGSFYKYDDQDLSDSDVELDDIYKE